jgi:glutaredoxin 3
MVTYIGNLAGIGGVAALREIALVARIEVYSSYFCPYCARAKALLERKGVTFETIDLMEQPSRRAEMIERAGGRTSVPQIFIDGEHIGGCDDLHALDKAGQLDAKLAT